MIAYARSLLFVLGLVASTITPARAQDQATIAEAEKLFTVMRMDQTVKAVLPLMWQQIVQLMTQQNPAVKSDLEQLVPIMNKLFEDSLPAFKAEMAKIYARKFSAEELRQMGAFMASPVGQKFVSEQGPLAQEAMRVGQAWGQTIGPKAVEMLQQELRKKGHKI